MMSFLQDRYGWNPAAGFTQRILYLALLIYFILVWLPATLPAIKTSDVSSVVAVSSVTIKLLQRSLLLALVSATLALLPGVAVGTALWWHRGIVYRCRWLLFIFLFLPPFLLVQGWMAVGNLTSWFNPPAGFWWSAVIMAMAFAPLTALIVASAKGYVDNSALQSSAISGGGPAMLRLVIIPQLKPYLAAGWVLTAVMVILEGGVPLSLQLPVMATDLTSRFMMGEPASSLLVRLWPVYLIVGAGFGVVWKLLFSGSHRNSEAFETGLLQPSWFGRISLYLRLALYFTAAVYFIPLAGIVWQAVAGDGSGMNFSSDWQAVFQTSQIALFVAFSAVIIAMPLGAWLASGRSWLLPAVLLIPLVFPAGLTGIAWAYHGVKIKGLLQYLPDSALMITAHLARVLPVAAIISLAVFRAWEGNAYYEAALLYKNSISRRLWINLPRMLLIGLAAGVFSLRELEIALLTVPPGGETLPLRVFNLMHYGAGADVCRLSLLLLLPVIFSALIIERKLK